MKYSELAGRSRGQPIGRLMAQALQHPHLISLAAGFVDNATLPCEGVSQVLEGLADDKDLLRKSLQYGTTAGMVTLRQAIADWNYAPWPNAKPTPERIILSAGSNQLLYLIAQTVCNPGDIVLTAAPTYFVFTGALQSVGARAFGVLADQDGICIDALRKQLEHLAAQGLADKVKAIYCVTDYDNPGGSSLSLERRKQLLELVSAWRKQYGPLIIISDCAYQHIRFDGPSLPPLLSIEPEAAGYVIELGTFSKVFSPGIRVGWGVFPTAMVETLLDIKASIDFGSPHFAQVVMERALTSGILDDNLPHILHGYRSKRDAMLEALETHFSNIEGASWRVPHGGLYVWLTLPDQLDTGDTGRLWHLATSEGVLYVPGQYCFPAEGQLAQKNTMRLSYGVQSSKSIAEGIRRLGHAVRTCMPVVA